MTILCLCLITIILRIAEIESLESFSSNVNADGHPILRIRPKDNNDRGMHIDLPVVHIEAGESVESPKSINRLRKRKKPHYSSDSSKERSDSRTVIPEASLENFWANIGSLDTANMGYQIKEKLHKNEISKTYKQQQIQLPDVDSGWKKDLRTYIGMLANKYGKETIMVHIKPVIESLERKHSLKIKDIDVGKEGKVKIVYSDNSK